MPDDVGDEFESDWVLEPPAPGQVHLHIAVGSDVELSSEARAALERLMSGLQEEEVAGFVFSMDVMDVQVSSDVADYSAKCGAYKICNPYGACQPLTKKPCAAFVNCRVAGIA